MKNVATTSDLRIGNWLYESEKSGFPMQVEGIGKDWIYLNFDGNEGDVWENTGNEIYPIPLNESILENAGYTKYHSSEWISKDKSYCIEEVLEDGSFWYLNEIKYVHELQNLNYALTGKELEIKME